MLCAFPLVLLKRHPCFRGHPCLCSILPIGALRTPRHFFRYPPLQSLEPLYRIRPGCSPGGELFDPQQPALHPLLFIGICSVARRLLNKIISLCNFWKWKSQVNQWFLTSWPLCILNLITFVYYAQNNYSLSIIPVSCFLGEILHQMNKKANNQWIISGCPFLWGQISPFYLL